tara:strand:- start:870 stop:1454 length:585 start_codon:yes stop_codon:yes gene_type:complete
MKIVKRHKRSYTNGSDSDDDDQDVIIKTYKNEIFYRGEIKEPQATEFCVKLKQLADEYHDSHILLHLTTEGGDLFCGIFMYEALRNCRTPVHVIAESQVCSAGTIVMLGASKRFMYSTSVILVHSLSSWMNGMQKPKAIREELHNSETLLEIMSEIYKRHTKFTATNLKKMYDTDLYMRSSECLSRGFIDTVLS